MLRPPPTELTTHVGSEDAHRKNPFVSFKRTTMRFTLTLTHGPRWNQTSLLAKISGPESRVTGPSYSDAD